MKIRGSVVSLSFIFPNPREDKNINSNNNSNNNNNNNNEYNITNIFTSPYVMYAHHTQA